MPKYKINYSNENRAHEAFAVLINRSRPSRSYTRAEMKKELSDPEIYQDFLKLCAEHDNSDGLDKFREGLLHVIRAIGISWTAEATGISRVTLYRMLSRPGNPELRNFVKVLKFLGLRHWVVSEEFTRAGRDFVRYNKVKPDEVVVSHGRRIGPKRHPEKARPRKKWPEEL